MKKILVTGGFGFIGTTLVEQLLTDPDNHVHVVDDLSTSATDVYGYMSSLEDGHNCTYDITTVDQYFKFNVLLQRYDEIYHLASPVGPASVIQQGGQMIRKVVNDIYLIMDYCTTHGTRLLDISTSEVYGGGDNDGYCSEATPKIFPEDINMRMEYAIAKLAAEVAIQNTCKLTNLHAVIIRPFNVAGKRQSVAGGFVVPRFVQQAVNGIPYTVFNDGEDIRAFTHVDDIVDGLRLAMLRGKNGTIYNLGNPLNKIKIKELPAIINGVLGVDNGIEYVDPKLIYGDYYESAADKYPNSQRAFDELGWAPSKNIETVIFDYYAEYQRQKRSGTLTQTILTEANDEIKK